jgi:aspartyl-tRNA(Asn)/glutamyl-tRNA(Gln) amidotransferase subunit A
MNRSRPRAKTAKSRPSKPRAAAAKSPARSKRSASALPETVAEAARRLRAGTLTCRQLAAAYLEGIARLDHKLRAFVTVTEDEALARADALDAELRAGRDRGPLHGVPVVYKDLYDTAGVLTTAGSGLFRQRIPDEDATIVRKLDRAGTVMLGKTNLTELATCTSGFNRDFGDTANPWNVDHAVGGSSSGTAAAVAAGLTLVGVGSDTGGSIRIPASWTGIVGVRPTFGLVSLHGAWPRAWSLDTCGPMTRTVADAALLFNAMTGYDPRYPKSIRAPRVDYTAELDRGVKGLRLGVIDNFTFENVDAEVGEAVRAAVERLRKLGADVRPVRIPLLTGALKHSSIFNVLLYEFKQILGERYRAAPDKGEAFGPVVRANMARAAGVTAEDYRRALAERPAQVAEVVRVFEQVDALITPTVPIVAPPMTQPQGSDAYDRGRQFNLPIGYLGLPAVTVPCGFSAAGLPIGMQVIGAHLQEARILRIAAAYESATGFTSRRPPVHIATPA